MAGFTKLYIVGGFGGFDVPTEPTRSYSKSCRERAAASGLIRTISSPASSRWAK